MADNTTPSIPAVAKEESGWRARLDLTISHRRNKSVISRSSQKGPLTIQSPFYPEGDVCHLYLLHPPAGIVGGDRLHLDISAEEKGTALITTPGATKFYRSEGTLAYQQQEFTVTDGATLEWLPQETIYFPNAHAKLATNLYIEGNGQYIGWDIHCLGLPANDEDLADGTVEIRFNLTRGGRPLLIEGLKITPEKKEFESAFLQGCNVTATMVSTGANQKLLDDLRENLPNTEYGQWGATLIEDILIIRYLGEKTNEARKLFTRAWTMVRPITLGRKAERPRIWAT